MTALSDMIVRVVNIETCENNGIKYKTLKCQSIGEHAGNELYYSIPFECDAKVGDEVPHDNLVELSLMLKYSVGDKMPAKMSV